MSIGFEQVCEEMELDDEEAKDFVQRQRSRWKELVRHPDRVDIVLDKMLAHFLKHPDPSRLQGAARSRGPQGVRGLPRTPWTKGCMTGAFPRKRRDVIISEAQNSEPDIVRFEYAKAKQDELIDYFKLTPKQWEDWNRERHGDDRSRWRPPLKILIVCDRLLTGFNAPVEQVHVSGQAAARPQPDSGYCPELTGPLPSMKKPDGGRRGLFRRLRRPGKGAQLRRERP